MSKIAFIYPGQGAQIAGMGADFYANSNLAKELYDAAGEALGFDVAALCFEKNDLLDQTEYTQAAMVTTCLAMTRELQARGIHADMTAGLSLGEYAAIAAAGGISELDAIKLVRKRGILMQHTVPAGAGAMCAVLAMDAEKIEEVIAPIADVSIANYNCPGQIVITGKTEAVAKSVEALKANGARRTMMLNVSGPFHSALLEPAGDELRKALEQTTFHPLNVPYVTNVTAQKVSDIGETPELLAVQVSSPVKWMQSVVQMIEEGVETFIEIGPGRTLAGFMKKINRDVKVFNVSSWEDLEQEGLKSC